MAEREHRSAGPAQVADREPGLVGVARRSIAARDDYSSATRLLEQLKAAGFPAQRAVVVGADLRELARERGRLSTVGVTGRGGLLGLLVGAAVGWMILLFDLMTTLLQPWWLVANTAVLGAVLGAAVALAGYVLTQGGRSFTADDPVRAGHYEVMADADVADHAVQLLQTEPAEKDQPDEGTVEADQPS